MSRPRPIFPNTTYTASRRTTQRQYFLRADPEIEQIILYCLACAARRYGVLVHAWMVMFNHFHDGLTDIHGNLPDFMACLNKLIAKAVNCLRGRWENLFAPGSYGASAIVDADDTMDKLVYILANPVAAGIVSHSKRWKGASSRNWRFGETRMIRRPTIFFDPDGNMPAEVPLTLSRPPGFDHLTNVELDAELRRRLIECESTIRAEFHEQGRTFLGMHAAMHVSPEDSPDTLEPRRKLNPRFACRDPHLRVVILRGYLAWLVTYRAAFLDYRDGNRDAVFPDGTYLMWIRHHVQVAARASPAFIRSATPDPHPPPPG